MNSSSFRRGWESWRNFLLKRRTSSGILRELILEDEKTEGYDRNNVRAKAKNWLIANGAKLGDKDILLARAHFGYLLPVEWGS